MSKIQRAKKTVRRTKKSKTTKTQEIAEPLPKTNPADCEGIGYYYEGKCHKVGSIVMIGYKPYFAKPLKDGDQRNRIRNLKKKKLAGIILDEEQKSEEEEGDENNFDEYAGNKDEQKIIENIEEDSSEEDEVPKRLQKPIFTPYVETDVEFEFKEFPEFEGPSKDFAEEMGITVGTKTKLVPKKYSHKIVGYELRYGGYDKYIVVKNSKGRISLKPYIFSTEPEITSTRIDIIDRKLSAIPTHKNRTKKTSVIYKGSLKLGDCIKIPEEKNEKLEGVILRADDQGFDIVTMDGVIHKNIKYREVESSWNTKRVPKKLLGKAPGTVKIGKNIFHIETKNKSDSKNLIAKSVTIPPYVYGMFEKEVVDVIEGTITDYDDGEEEFVVKLKNEDPENPGMNIIKLPYDYDVDLCPRRETIKSLIGAKPLTAKEYLKLPVDFFTRQHITRIMFSAFGDFIPDVYDSDIDKNPILVDLNNKIDWSIVSAPHKTWNEYYEENLKAWFFTKIYPEVVSKVPDFEDEAQQEYEKSVDPMHIVENLIAEFGNIFEESGHKLLYLITQKAEHPLYEPTILDVTLRRELVKIGDSQLKMLSGSSLAIEIARIISNLLTLHPPPSVENIKNVMANNWINDEISNRKISKTDKDNYKKQFSAELKKLYSEYDEKREIMIAQAAKYKELRSKLENERAQRSEIQRKIPRLADIVTVNGKQLSMKGLLLADDLQMLEEKIYVDTNGINGEYLRKLMDILIFIDLNDEVGKHASFFRSKIISGLYPISTLDSITYFYTFPELFANKSLSNESHKLASKKLESVISGKVLEFIEIYLMKTPPTNYQGRSVMGSKFDWSKYLQPPNKSCAGYRIRKDVKYGGIDDSENYNCERIGDSEDYKCEAKYLIEPIPNDDLILDFNPKTGEFSCASINDVLYALKEQNEGLTPINYVTGVKYSDSFLKRMRIRYQDLIKIPMPERVLSFKANEDDLFFGGFDFKAYEKQKLERLDKKSSKPIVEKKPRAKKVLVKKTKVTK